MAKSIGIYIYIYKTQYESSNEWFCLMVTIRPFSGALTGPIFGPNPNAKLILIFCPIENKYNISLKT